MSDLSFGAKQPYEEYFITFDFVNEIDSSDSIESAEITVVDSNGGDVTDDLTDFSKESVTGTKVYVWIQGGITGNTYTITCRVITTVLGEMYEVDADIAVLEI